MLCVMFCQVNSALLLLLPLLRLSSVWIQLEKEETRKKNMNKARRFDAEFQQELELRRKELELEEAEKAER